MTQIAPVIGIGIAYAVSSNTFWSSWSRASSAPCCWRCSRSSSRRAARRHSTTPVDVTLKSLVTSYGFNVRKYPDFAWNWLGRFIFFIGLYFNTTFGTFFYAQRLDLPVREVAGVVATIGMLGVLAAAGGALAGRLPLATSSSVGAAVRAASARALRRRRRRRGIRVARSRSSSSAPCSCSSPIAVFATVDQAIVFAILPDRAQAGRYMAVVAFAQKIPSAVAPLLASARSSPSAPSARRRTTRSSTSPARCSRSSAGSDHLQGQVGPLVPPRRSTGSSHERRACHTHHTTLPSTAAATNSPSPGAARASRGRPSSDLPAAAGYELEATVDGRGAARGASVARSPARRLAVGRLGEPAAGGRGASGAAATTRIPRLVGVDRVRGRPPRRGLDRSLDLARRDPRDPGYGKRPAHVLADAVRR